MNRKQFLILLVLVLVIGGGGLAIYRRSNNSWENTTAALGAKLLPDLAVNNIAQIHIKSGTNELHLVRQDNLWRVRERANYPANFSQISDWLIKLADLKIIQTQDIGPSQLGRFSLLAPGPETNTATLVEFADANGKVLNTLLLGKKHMKQPTGQQPAGMDEAWPDGRYVMVGSGATSLDVVSDPMESAEPKPDQWLDRDFINVEKPSSIAVQFPATTNSWKLTRTSETNDWALTDAGPKEKLDSSKVSGVTTPFSSPSFNDIMAPDTKPEVSGMTNTTTVNIGTLDGFNYTAEIGQKQSDNYPVTFTVTANLPTAPTSTTSTNAAADFKAQQKTLTDKLTREQACQHWIYLVPTYAIDPLLKVRGDLLLVETNASTATNSATPVIDGK